MPARCPGSDMRNISAEDVLCPGCGEMVELFSDERKRRCPNCGTRVERSEPAPMCAAWCPAAAECLGAERYAKLVESGAIVEKDEPEG